MSGKRLIRATSNPFEQRLYAVSPRSSLTLNEAASMSVGTIRIDATGRTQRDTSQPQNKKTRRFSLNNAIAALAAFGTIMVATLAPASIDSSSLSEHGTNNPTAVQATQEKHSSGITQEEEAALKNALDAVQARVESKNSTNNTADINKGTHLKIGALVIEDKGPTNNIVRLVGQGKIRILKPAVSVKRLPPIKLMADQLKIRVINPTGKKVNVGGSCGLPFDLSPFANHYDVASHAANETKDTQTPPKPSVPQTGERAYAGHPLFKPYETNIPRNDFFAALLAKYMPQHTETPMAFGKTRPLVPGYSAYVSKPYPSMNVMARALVYEPFNITKDKLRAPKEPVFLRSIVPAQTFDQLHNPTIWDKASRTAKLNKNERYNALEIAQFYLDIANALQRLGTPTAEKARYKAIMRGSDIAYQYGLVANKSPVGLSLNTERAKILFHSYKFQRSPIDLERAMSLAAVGNYLQKNAELTQLLSEGRKFSPRLYKEAKANAPDYVKYVLLGKEVPVTPVVANYIKLPYVLKPEIRQIEENKLYHLPLDQVLPMKKELQEPSHPVAESEWNKLNGFGTYKTSSLTFSHKNG